MEAKGDIHKNRINHFIQEMRQHHARVNTYPNNIPETVCQPQSTERWIEDKLEQLLRAGDDKKAMTRITDKLSGQPPHCLHTIANGLEKMLEATTITENSQPEGMELMAKEEEKRKNEIMEEEEEEEKEAEADKLITRKRRKDKEKKEQIEGPSGNNDNGGIHEDNSEITNDHHGLHIHDTAVSYTVTDYTGGHLTSGSFDDNASKNIGEHGKHVGEASEIKSDINNDTGVVHEDNSEDTNYNHGLHSHDTAVSYIVSDYIVHPKSGGFDDYSSKNIGEVGKHIGKTSETELDVNNENRGDDNLENNTGNGGVHAHADAEIHIEHDADSDIDSNEFQSANGDSNADESGSDDFDYNASIIQEKL
jgi:hypothetical protein